MTEIKTQPVDAVLVDSILDAKAGSISFYNESDHRPGGFRFQCPCGCGVVGSVRVSPGGWQWNGSKDRPTVNPSVRLATADGSHWHGWLKDGVWRSC